MSNRILNVSRETLITLSHLPLSLKKIFIYSNLGNYHKYIKRNFIQKSREDTSTRHYKSQAN